MKKSSFLKRLNKRWSRDKRVVRLRKIASSQRFARYYLAVSIAVLTFTTVLWATLGAILHSVNADQLVNADLLESGKTFEGAEFAGQHSFLFKLPVFFIIKLAGYSDAAYIITTVAVVLLTIAILVYLLRKIDPRPLPLGTICLAMASVLLLVPTVPYSGALLPVNMAMATTRNLEYMLYIVALVCFFKATRIRSRHFGLGILLLTLLISSDKLFMSISIGGALLVIVGYSRTARIDVITKAFNWFIGTVIATIVATGVLALFAVSGITGISSQGAGPYGFVSNAKDLALGVGYGLAGLLTNLGANPAYDAIQISEIPSKTLSHIASFAGLGLIMNVGITAIVFIWASKLVRGSMIKTPRKMIKADNNVLLSIALISSTAAALVAFIGSQHYYAVDARYLAICFFAAVVTASTWLARKKKLQSEIFALAGAILLSCCLLSSIAAVYRHIEDTAALRTITERDAIVAKALSAHRVDVLVGDYWRVVPIKHATKHQQKVMPLGDCVTARTILSSKSWQPDLTKTSFAYLLTVRGSLTDFPECNLEQVVGTYGRPNASYLVSGSLSDPQEILLFYDRGTTTPPVRSQRATAVTVLPTPLQELPNTTCDGPTTMNIVAHQDDDLLFLSPDVLRDVQSGRCVRTVYVTAGDAGNDRPYWLEREQGSQAAYSSMLESDELWIQRTVTIGPEQYATVAYPRGNPRVSLIFMHIADGNLRGQGFETSRYQTISKLFNAPSATVQTVDGQSTYTEQSLIDALTALMSRYEPSQIRTQSTLDGTMYTDHSDHMSVGKLVKSAHAAYESKHYGGDIIVPITYYRGYPINESVANVSGEELRQKQAAFLAYARFDGSVCHTEEQCDHSETYGSYLKRQYTETQ